MITTIFKSENGQAWRDSHGRFGVQYSSGFVRSMAEEIERLQADNRTAWQQVNELSKELGTLQGTIEGIQLQGGVGETIKKFREHINQLEQANEQLRKMNAELERRDNYLEKRF